MFWKEGNHFCASCHHDNTYGIVDSLTTKQNAEVLALMVLLGSSSSEVKLLASDISSSTLSLGQLRFIIRISSLNFSRSFYCLLWHCCLLLVTSVPHDANTFNACGEMVSGWQVSLLLRLTQQPVCDDKSTSGQLVADLLLNISEPECWWNRSSTDRWPTGDWLATIQRLLKIFTTSWQSKPVVASLLCILKRLAASDRRIWCNLCKTLPRLLLPLCDSH